MTTEFDLLSDEWVDALVAATSSAPESTARPATVALTIGKTRRAVLALEAGRVTGVGSDDDVTVTVPFTAAQLNDLLAGRESLATSYVKGDVKPDGAIGGFLSLVELFESTDLSSAAN